MIQILASIPSSAAEHDKPNELHCEDHIVVSLGFEAAEHFLGSSIVPRRNAAVTVAIKKKKCERDSKQDDGQGPHSIRSGIQSGNQNL